MRRREYDVYVNLSKNTIYPTGETWVSWQAVLMPDHGDWADILYRGIFRKEALQQAANAAKQLRECGHKVNLDVGQANDNASVHVATGGVA